MKQAKRKKLNKESKMIIHTRSKYSILLIIIFSICFTSPTICTDADRIYKENSKADIESCKQAVKINPDEAEAHNNLGYAYYESGKYKEAIESYKQAVKISPDDAKVHYNLGGIYGDLGKYKEAIKSYKQAVKISPDDAKAHYNLGVTYGDLGMYKEEIESYKQAIRIDPDFAMAHCNLGIAFYLSNDRDSAIEQYNVLKNLDSEQANKLFNFIGRQWEMSGRQWAFVPDMNYSGSITISDAWLWFKWLYFYPGDGVICLLLNIVPGLAQFLEITYNNYGGTLSGIISVLVWFPVAVIIFFCGLLALK